MGASADIVLCFEGVDVDLLEQETGGHRVQRVPHGEKQGRVHSSTVTVVVHDPAQSITGPWAARRPQDFEVQWFNGTVKAGGQFRNKTATACRLVHRPTGLVRTAQTRSRENSQRLAEEAMATELDRLAHLAVHEERNSARREQAGCGERADRRRVWAFQRGVVEDLVSGRRVSLREALRGGLDALWLRTVRASPDRGTVSPPVRRLS